MGTHINEGLVRDRFSLSILYQNQGDSDTSNVEGGRFSSRNLYQLLRRVRDDGADLRRDVNYRNMLNNNETRQFEDRRDLPGKSLITVTVIVGVQR